MVNMVSIKSKVLCYGAHYKHLHVHLILYEYYVKGICNAASLSKQLFYRLFMRYEAY